MKIKLPNFRPYYLQYCNQKSFKDLWLDEKWMKARGKLTQGKRDLSPCNICDVDGMRMGGKHAKAWEKFTNK
jgi:hypothetical protein